MAEQQKDQAAILNKLGIKSLNPMQVSAKKAIAKNAEIVLLSPTGSGKTLAFLLPILELLDPDLEEIQALILVTSRELAIQIEQVIREMGSGFKANAVYGGRAGYKDKGDLQHAPAILIGTPGRVADHIHNEVIVPESIKTLVLDEFDKSLETGFEEEMKFIISALSLDKKILTSATQKVQIPNFVGVNNAVTLDFLEDKKPKLEFKTVVSPDKDKSQTLVELLYHIGKQNGIVFCNFKDTIHELSDALDEAMIDHACFFGGMEQIDRERALIKFRNGTHRLLIATDLAARGIDVPEMDFIIHYELPRKEDEFVHRNGRTARMNTAGAVYILKWQEDILLDFIPDHKPIRLHSKREILTNDWDTLTISGGRKDKISKGDIAGLFFKQGNLKKDELGIIELKQDISYVSVPSSKSEKIVAVLNNSKLKKKKVRISLLD